MNVRFNTPEEKQEFLDRIDVAILEIEKKAKAACDPVFVKKIPEITQKIQAKKDRGEKLNVRDLKSVLLIAKNSQVPAALLQQADRLRSLKKSVV